VKIKVLPILPDRRPLEAVGLGLGDPSLARLGHGDARARWSVHALAYIDQRLCQPGRRLFLRLEGFDMPPRLAVGARRGYWAIQALCSPALRAWPRRTRAR
jgi:hypothetical protein